jgi:O-antigen/teichoic acid export membrane protein/peptidoglycan/LPS O-acetylase OafA/YrhL
MDEKHSLTKRTFIGLLWASGESMAKVLLQIGVMIVLSRLLTPIDFGITGMAMAIIGITQVFAQLGVGPAVVQREVIEPRHIKTAALFSICFSLLAGGVIFLTAGALARFVDMPTLEPTLRALSLLFPMTGISVVPESLLQRELKFRTLAKIEVASYAIGFAVASIALAFLGYGLWALVIGQWLWMSVRSVLMVRAIDHPLQLGFDWRAFRELWEFSGGQTVLGVANYATTNGDNLVIGKFLGPQALGIFNRAGQLTPLVLIGQVLDKVLFPALSKVQTHRELMGRAFRQGTQLVTVVILPLTAVTIFLAPDAVPFVLGDKWVGVVLPLQLFSLRLLWRFGMKVNNSFIRACGAVNLLAVSQIVYAISLVVCAWIGAKWGLPGVCIAILVPLFGCYAFSVMMCLNLTKIRLSAFLLDQVPGVLLCSLTVVGGWLSYNVLHVRALPPLVTIIVATVVMGSFTLAALVIWPEYLLGEYGKKIKKAILPIFARRLSQLTEYFRRPNKTAASPAEAKSSYRLTTLDTFRGLAALGVLIYHYCLRYWEILGPNPNQLPEGHGIFLGTVFPWFFFVISGFVIFMTLRRTANAFDFVVSRFSRLYPAYWAAVIITFAVMAIFPISGRTYPLYVGIINLTMLQGWAHQPNIDGVYWTLMIELSFYCLMFCFFTLKQLHRIQWIGLVWLLIQCAVAIAERTFHHELPTIIANSILLGYFQLFFAGILFYQIRSNGWNLFRCLLLGLCVLTHGIVYNSFAAAIEALIFVVLFLLFVCDLLPFLSNRPLIYLGTISYTLYLIHQNIGYTIIYHLSALGLPHWAGVVVAIILSLFLASILSFFVEKPALKAIRDWYKQRKVRNEQLAAARAATGSTAQ